MERAAPHAGPDAARRPVTFVVPGNLDTPTGGYRYDRRVVRGLRGRGRDVRVLELEGAFPSPSPADLDAADAALAGLPDGALVVVDGLAFGALPDAAQRHASRLDLVALVHHPLMHETGLSAADIERHRRDETRALAHPALIIVTSEATRAGLVELDVDIDAVAVVAPGTDAVPVAAGSGGEVASLLCVASITPRKDHATLVGALARLTDRPWRLTCVGDTAPSVDTVRALEALVASSGLRERVTLAGALDEGALRAHWHRADLFVLASVHEGYGMVFDEAIAHGLPIVATRGGAIAGTVPADAGLLVEAGDVDAFADALASVLDDAALRARLRAGALAARENLRTWEAAVDAFAAALDGVGSRRPAAPGGLPDDETGTGRR